MSSFLKKTRISDRASSISPIIQSITKTRENPLGTNRFSPAIQPSGEMSPMIKHVDSMIDSYELLSLPSSIKAPITSSLQKIGVSISTPEIDHIFDYSSSPDFIPQIKKITGIKFTLLSDKEIDALAVVEITDSKMGGDNTVYDSRMGVLKNHELCPTCNFGWKECPHHFGKINLPIGIPHPILVRFIANMLSCFCAECHRLVITENQIVTIGLLRYKAESRFKFFLNHALKVVQCEYCFKPHGKVIVNDDKFTRIFKQTSELRKIPMTNDEIDNIFSNIRTEDYKLIAIAQHPIDFIIHKLLVIPPCVRPPIESGQDINHDDLSYKYVEIIKICSRLNDKSKPLSEKTRNDLVENLTRHIRTMMDNAGSKDKEPGQRRIMRCVSEDTPISLACGIALPIKELENNKFDLLSFDEKHNGITFSVQSDFFDQKEKECIELTFTDGRKITTTMDHKFLTNDGEWIEAQNIGIKNTFIKMGLDNVNCYDFNDYPNYILDCGEESFDMSIYEDKMKAMALCRMMGYVITDGSYNDRLFMGHKLDVDVLSQDVYLLTQKIPKPYISKTTINIYLSVKIKRMISMFIPLQEKGGKPKNDMKLPEFIFEENCPLFLIREFLAGLYGGDGCVPCLTKKNNRTTLNIGSICNTCSKFKDNVQSATDQYERIVKLLKKRFDIEAYVSPPVLYDEERKYYRIDILINKQVSKLKFIENIGYRYCFHKQYRAMAVGCYLRYKKNITRQAQIITQRAHQLWDNYKLQHPTKKVHQFSLEGKFIEEFDSVIDAQDKTGIQRSNIYTVCDGRRYKTGDYKWAYALENPQKMDEKGCKTIALSVKEAISELRELEGIIDDDYLKSLCDPEPARFSIPSARKNHKFTQPVIDTEYFINFCGLEDFINDDKETKYTVNREAMVLPCYKMQVIFKKFVGLKKVKDIEVHNFHNFVANGIIIHNCLKQRLTSKGGQVRLNTQGKLLL